MVHPLRAYRWLIFAIAVAVVATACGSSDPATAEQADSPILSAETPSGLLPEPEPSEDATPPTTAATSVAPTAVVVEAPEPTVDPLGCLSRRQRVAQLLLPLVTQAELARASEFAAVGELGGVGLLGSPDSGLSAELAAMQSVSAIPVLVASDEEGGSVQRLAALLGPLPSASAAARERSPEEVRRQWVEYGARVNDVGIDVIFGPVLDVGGAPGIESRSFSEDPAVVSAYGRAVADGLLEAGVLPVFKHFPGHGRATADSHLELPTTPTIDEMRSWDLLPYYELLAEPVFRDRVAVMTGHLAVPGLSDTTPASLSTAAVTDLLRGEIGFTGLVFTDALNMGAIVNTYGVLEALELAFEAGSDIAILGSLSEVSPALDHLVTRAETDAAFAVLLDNRAARVLASKGQTAPC